MKFFNASDFTDDVLIGGDRAAQLANAKLEREAKVVYICEGELKTIHFVQPVDATHRALLICIEEIERKPCEHLPLARNASTKREFYCGKCSKELKPTGWEVVDE